MYNIHGPRTGSQDSVVISTAECNQNNREIVFTVFHISELPDILTLGLSY